MTAPSKPLDSVRLNARTSIGDPSSTIVVPGGSHSINALPEPVAFSIFARTSVIECTMWVPGAIGGDGGGGGVEGGRLGDGNIGGSLGGSIPHVTSTRAIPMSPV
eukprot:289832-Prymnesium_polylepis.2